MSFQMIHMEIAYRLLSHIPDLEYPAEFILGSVSPDSVHMHSKYDISMKIMSHMFEGCGPWGDTQDYDRWLDNIHELFCEYAMTANGKAYRDFVLGLCVHCLSDYHNDLKIWRRLQKENIPPMGLDSFKDAYYPEARGIDLWLYQNSKNANEIRKLLFDAQAFDVDGLVWQAEIQKQREHLLYTQYDVERIDISGYRFLSASVIEEFLETTVSDIAETIKSWRENNVK